MTDTTQEVLAKSGPPISLKQHIDDCLIVLNSLRNAFERLPVISDKKFWELVRLGIIFHDLGKSHTEFQKILAGKRANWYHQRHELFSTPFIDWLDISEEERILLKLIVSGHHKDFHFLFDHIQKGYKTGDDLLSFGEEGKLVWDEETKKLNVEYIKTILKVYKVLLKPGSLIIPSQLIKDYTHNPVTSHGVNFKELLLAAGALKQCDHLASAGIFNVSILKESHFNSLYEETWTQYYHQKKASEINGNIILTAPTGSGKTEASLLWLDKQIKENGHGRTFYILPYTASINAMFERLDKTMEGGNEIVGLMHGKLSEYIESRFGDDMYSWQNEQLKKELKDKFKALLLPMKVTTPFQLLKSIFGLKGFEKGIFEMSGGYFIFDEIHAYDPEVIAQIKVLIEFATKFLNVKVCIMTATLPKFLKNEFIDALGEYSEISADVELYKTLTRHRIRLANGLLSDNVESIQKRLNEGEKVLVVCNTIKQAQQIYTKLQTSKKVLLHGAFNSRDRNKIESELKSSEVKLLIGTQAIEVRLDIDYDVIFSEPAPLDALIQRFGRVNRHRTNGKYRSPCDCIVFSERNEVDKYIYRNESVITRTLDALQKIETQNYGIVSEIDLQFFIDQVYPEWSDKEKEDFERVYKILKNNVENKLSPFIYDLKSEEDFEKQFDNVQVIPVILRNDYTKELSNNHFIKAESLKVTITKQRFASLITNNGISKESYVFQKDNKEIIKDHNFFVINRKYDSEIGLQIDIAESIESNYFL